VLGLGRDRDEPVLESIREGLQLPGARKPLDAVVQDVIFQIKEYRFQGFEIVGIVGKNGSPSCGVESSYAGGKHVDGIEGIFIMRLREALKNEKLDVPIKGVDDHRQEETIAWLKQRLGA
jgi:predicted secreted protein